MNRLISTKNLVVISMVGPFETRKSQPVYNWLKNGTLQPKLDKIYFFNQHSQTLHVNMQKKNENLEIVQGVNFEFLDLLKNNGTKNLLIFDDSCEKNCYSKPFVDVATAGRHLQVKHNYLVLLSTI